MPEPAPGPDPAFRAVVGRLLEVSPARLHFQALSGGVSSDIWRVDTGTASYCAKRALPRLRVAVRWEAPVSRNAEEVRWLRTVRPWIGDRAARVIAADPGAGVALLAWYDPAHWRNWKTELLAGRVDRGCAGKLGTALGTIAAQAATAPGLAAEFANEALFEALRVDPFFRYLRHRHPAVDAVIDELVGTRETLVHGDFSPKNVLVDAAGEVRVLDAECATWGSAAFDPGYLLAHLLIKAQHTGNDALLAAAATFWQAYRDVVAERFADLERRTRLIIGGMLLARVDGKSPVEYLDPVEQQAVRRRGVALLASPDATVTGTLATWRDAR